MVVACGRYSYAQQVLVVVHSLDHRAEKQEELGVLIGGLPRGEQIYARVGRNGPVVVLAAAVYPVKGLFVQKAHQAVPGGYLLHNLHGQLVVVRGHVGGGIDGGQLVLCGRHFVMLGLSQYPQFPQLVIQLLHIGRHPGFYYAEVVVVHLLSFGRALAKEGTAGETQIRALIVHLLGYEEVFLFGPHRGAHALYLLVAEQPDNAHGLIVKGRHGAQQGRFLIQSLAAVGTESCRDTQGFSLYKSVGGGVPGGISPGLEGCSETSGRK